MSAVPRLARIGGVLALSAWLGACAATAGTGTETLGVVVERAAGSVVIIDTETWTAVRRVEGLGDLSHASMVFSRDGRQAYVFGRDGGLNQVDLASGELVRRVVQAGNSIGGAISQDGRLVAVANYQPGGVRVFDAETLDPVADIPATWGADGETSKVVGLVDAPGNRFVWSLWDAGEIQVADFTDPAAPVIVRHRNIGDRPYDGLITPDGRDYVAGLFGEDGVVVLDLTDPEARPRRILDNYGRGEEPLPVYKMPHLEGWASSGDRLFLPAVGRHEVLVVDRESWRESGRIEVHSQPVFVVARPGGGQVWVNFAHPDNDTVQVIDTETLEIVRTLQPGPAVLHMEFLPDGRHVLVSVRDADRVEVYDTETFERIATIPADKPSGIFLTDRANRIGL